MFFIIKNMFFDDKKGLFFYPATTLNVIYLLFSYLRFLKKSALSRIFFCRGNFVTIIVFYYVKINSDHLFYEKL